MHKAGVWSMAVVLTLGLTQVIYADEQTASKPSSLSWWQRLLGQREEPAAPVSAESIRQKAQRKAAMFRARRAKEEADYLKRESACLRLMEIATQIDDPQLYKRAQELNDRAWKIYLQRTSPGKLTQTDQAAEALLKPSTGQTSASNQRAEIRGRGER